MSKIDRTPKNPRSIGREQFNDLVKAHENLPDLVRGQWAIDERSLEPTTLTLNDARAATMLFMEGRLTSADAERWADIVLGSRIVFISPSYAPILLEFLAEWSRGRIPIDLKSVASWQGIFDDYQSAGLN